MEIFKKLAAIKEAFSDDYCLKKNNTVLYGLHSDLELFARHTIYKALTDELIQKHLVSQYKNTFPEQYIEFLKHTNGMSLFGVRLYKKRRFYYAPRLLQVYGLPLRRVLAPPYNIADQPEPYDLRMEDLDRHDDIPNCWLKCGSYIKESDFNISFDIFINTESGRVYSCKRKDSVIVDEWSDLDNCFCCLFDILKDTKEEYHI